MTGTVPMVREITREVIVTYTVELRPMLEEDIGRVTELAAQNFRGFRTEDAEDSPHAPEARAWVEGCFRAAPRSRYFVATVDGVIHGYILWTYHGGPRQEAVVELDQVATSVKSRELKLGIGTVLLETLDVLRAELEAAGRVLKMVFIFTRDGDGAAAFYQKAFGARQVCVIPEMYRGNEAVLVRNYLREPETNGDAKS